MACILLGALQGYRILTIRAIVDSSCNNQPCLRAYPCTNPTAQDEKKLEQKADQVDGKPQTIQARRHLGKAQKDETSIMMSVHASLPVSFVSSPKGVRSGVIVQLS